MLYVDEGFKRVDFIRAIRAVKNKRLRPMIIDGEEVFVLTPGSLIGSTTEIFEDAKRKSHHDKNYGKAVVRNP